MPDIKILKYFEINKLETFKICLHLEGCRLIVVLIMSTDSFRGILTLVKIVRLKALVLLGDVDEYRKFSIQ